MSRLKNGEVFELSNASQSGVLSLVMVITSGSVQLQKLAGDDVSGTWVDVNDGNFTSTDECTFWAPPGQKYRTLFTDAEVFRKG
jgi:hypothetical protein